MEQQIATTPQELHSDEVRFTLHLKPSCMMEYDVEAFVPLVKEAHKKAVKRISKEVSLHGFRKGKAPDALVEKNFSKEVDKEWQSEIASLAFQACQKLSKIRPLHTDAKVKFTMKSHSKSGALLTLSFEIEPVVPIVDPKHFTITAVKRPEVNEDKVNETIRQIQLFFATWDKVTDRPVQEGDFVLLDVEVIENDPATPLFSDTRFEVLEKSMAKWMFDLVLGKRLHEVCEGVSVPDESASVEDKETLQPKKVRLTIKAIELPTAPPLDDDFIKNLGVSSLEELKENITALLNKQADEHVKEAQRTQVSNFLLTQYPFELPPSLILEETRYRFQQLGQDPDFHHYWNQLSQEERNKTIVMINTQAEKAIRLFYLCRRIIADARISITAQDLPPAASNPLELLLNPQKIHHHQRTPEVEHAEAYSRLLLEKAQDYLASHSAQQA
ncbi:MAG TPA: trigger factor [Rhabdochlamydiaceae bacterium]|jgi:trigger factor